MMASILHISLNGPSNQSEECNVMLTEATKVWSKAHLRNLPLLKKLPSIGRTDHPAAKIDIVIQVDFASEHQASEAQDNSEISSVSELDRHVQVEAQPVPIDFDVCHEALDAMDMGDVEFCVDSDFDFDFDMEDD